MKRNIVVVAGFLCAVLLSACGPSSGVRRLAGAPETKETVFARGHSLYAKMDYENAEAYLRRAVAMDSTYADPAADLGFLHYDVGMRREGEELSQRAEDFRKALSWLRRADALGYHDASLYDRICEIALALDDNRAFLTYARKSVELSPFDRQYYNLGLACYGADDWQGTIKSQKEAVEKFKQSQYLGGFYRQMSRAYLKLDRDQTAEKVLASGVEAVDLRLAAVAERDGGEKKSDEYRRLNDDKIAMLLLLKRLHITYKAAEKLANVERQLSAAGYGK